MQYAQDNDMRLEIMRDSWAMVTVLNFFMADGENEDKERWIAKVERALCVKIFYETNKLIEHKMTLKSQKYLLFAKSSALYDEFVVSQLQFMRAMFQHPNLLG